MILIQIPASQISFIFINASFQYVKTPKWFDLMFPVPPNCPLDLINGPYGVTKTIREGKQWQISSMKAVFLTPQVKIMVIFTLRTPDAAFYIILQVWIRFY
jgi:hypothetical protein